MYTSESKPALSLRPSEVYKVKTLGLEMTASYKIRVFIKIFE